MNYLRRLRQTSVTLQCYESGHTTGTRRDIGNDVKPKGWLGEETRKKAVRVLSWQGQQASEILTILRIPALFLHFLVGPVLQFLVNGWLNHHKGNARSSFWVGPHHLNLGVNLGLGAGQ
jgi:hypothetical protein